MVQNQNLKYPSIQVFPKMVSFILGIDMLKCSSFGALKGVNGHNLELDPACNEAVRCMGGNLIL